MLAFHRATKLRLEELESRLVLSTAALVSGDIHEESARWMVKLRADSGNALKNIEAIVESLASDAVQLEVMHDLGRANQVLVKAISGPSGDVERLLLADSSIVHAERDGRVAAGDQLFPNEQSNPNHDNFDKLFAFHNTGQEIQGGVAVAGADINGPEAWSIAARPSVHGNTVGSPEVVVGVLDTGVDYTHFDLAKNIWINQGEIPEAIRRGLHDVDDDGLFTFWDLNYRDPMTNTMVNQGPNKITDINQNGFIDGGDLLSPTSVGGWADSDDVDGNGFVDDLIGWDFVNNDNDPRDDQGHGTHVTGILAAEGNNLRGVTGVNWSSSVMALKVLDQQKEGNNSNIVRALNYVSNMRDRDVNVRVTNNSYIDVLPNSFSQMVFDAIVDHHNRGILFFAAAGNGDANGGINLDEDPYYPASYELDNLVTVAATTKSDELWRNSNFGKTSVDIAAPGVGILSTEMGGGIDFRNGTSMATPMAAGVAALLLANQPAASAAEIRAAVLEGSETIAALTDGNLLNGEISNGRRLTAAGALTADTFAPRATLVPLPPIKAANGTTQTITVRYTDDEGVDFETLDDNDIVITRNGFSAFRVAARIDANSLPHADADSKDFQVQYQYDVPDGPWQAMHNGTYRIELQPRQVSDVKSIPVGRQIVGEITVEIDDASVFFVDTRRDSIDVNPGDGIAADAFGDTSLRAAIMEANTTPGHQTIVIPDGKYVIEIPGPDEDQGASGDLDVNNHLAIIGGSSRNTILDANGLDRVFDIGSNNAQTPDDFAAPTVTIRDVQITGGAAALGAGIRNSGVVELSTSRIVGNSAQLNGGGIYNDGTLTIEGSTISGNATVEAFAKGGGAVFNDGSLAVLHSTFSDNSTSATQLVLGGGGAVHNARRADATMTNTTVSANRAERGFGGGILNAGQLQATHVTVTENVAAGKGGGIYNAQRLDTPPFVVDYATASHPQGRFGEPQDIAVHRGRIYIADTLNNRIQVFDNEGTFLYEFGSFGSDSGQFSSPNRLAVADDGRIYIHDQGNGRIQVFQEGEESGVIQFVDQFDSTFILDMEVDSQGALFVAYQAGIFCIMDSVRCNGQFQPASDLFRPSGISLDRNDNIYILEEGIIFENSDESRLRVVTREGNVVGSYSFPRRFVDIAVDNEGRIHLVGSNIEVYRWDNGSLVLDQTIEATADFIPRRLETSDVGVAYTLQPSRLNRPTVIAVDADGNESLRFGEPAVNEFPRGIFARPSGETYIVDTNRQRVQVYDSSGELQRELGAGGDAENTLSKPIDVVVDSRGTTYVSDADNGLIQVYDNQGIFVRSFGKPFLGQPRGLAIDANDLVYIVDADAQQIRVVDGFGDLQATIDDPLKSPRDVAVGPGGFVYVSDEDQIRVFRESDGGYGVERTLPGSFIKPNGLEVDEFGNIFVADTGASDIEVFAADHTFLYRFAIDGRASVDLGPTDIGIDQNGFLYVTDSRYASVLVYDSGLLVEGDAFVANSIIAGNAADADKDVAGDFDSAGGNLIGLLGSSGGFDEDIHGEDGGPLDPGLTALGNFGGPTLTHALLADSPAIDHGNNEVLTAIDQIGSARPQDGDGDGLAIADAGAVEWFLGEVHGTHFLDSNQDGIRSDGELGLAGWTVFADNNENGRLDPGEPQTLTQSDDPGTINIDESGNYVLSNLKPGRIPIRIVPHLNFEQTAPNLVRPESGVGTPKRLALSQAIQSLPVFADDRAYYSTYSQIIQVDMEGVATVVADGANLIEGEFVRIGNAGSRFRLAPDRDSVTFNGTDTTSFNVLGIFRTDSDGNIERLIDRESRIPGGSQGFTGDGAFVQAASDGLILFVGVGPVSELDGGIYATSGAGTIVPIVDKNSAVPNSTSRFSYFSETVTLEGSTFAFHGSGTDDSGVYVGSSRDTITPVADTKTYLPQSDLHFFRFTALTPLSLSDGMVAFRADGTDGSTGVYRGTNPDDLDVVADTNTAIPNGQGNFTTFAAYRPWHVSAGISQDQGNTAFVASGGADGQNPQQTGVYLSMEDGTLHKVVDLNDDFEEGKTADILSIGPDALHGDKLVFFAVFADRTVGIYVVEFPSDQHYTVDLKAGQVVRELDFGVYAPPGSIKGTVFDDRDGDTVQGLNETGLANRIVFLDNNADGVLNNPISGDGVCDSNAIETCTLSDNQGRYAFTNLTALRSYEVGQIPFDGWDQTSPLEPTSYHVELQAAQDMLDLDFGNRISQGGGGVDGTGSIQGIVFEDLNGDGRKNENEATLPGWSVYLDAKTVQSDAATGEFSFERLPTDSYSLGLVPRTGWTVTSPRIVDFQLEPFSAGGNVPWSVAVGDFDADNADDIAVVNVETNNVSILKNNGRGEFDELLSSHSIANGSVPVAIATGDFDRDNDLDLAVANRDSNNISVMLNRGNGTFAEQPPIRVLPDANRNPQPSSIITAHLNDDLYLDLVVTNELTGDVAILLNDARGNGHFSLSQNQLTGGGENGNSRPSSVAAGLLNDDSYVDLAIANSQTDEVTVLINNGNGNYRVGGNFSLGKQNLARGTQSLTLADFTTDGRTDIAVSNLISKDVTILGNGGGGDFVVYGNVSIGFAATAIAAADLDNDGDVDVAVSDGDLANLSVLVNRGNGTFDVSRKLGGSANLGISTLSSSLALADMNSDGIMDMVAANGQLATQVTVLVGDSSGIAHTVTLRDGEHAEGFAFGVRRRSPSLSPISDPAPIDEDTEEPQRVALSGIRAGAGDGESLQVEASSSDQTIIPDSAIAIDYRAPNTFGTLSYTIMPDANGTATITLRITDDGLDKVAGTHDDGHIEQSFDVVVKPVNDLPTALADSFDVLVGSHRVELDPLSNDTAAPDTDETLEFFFVGVPSSGGQVEVQDNATVLYSPPDGFVGTETFVYFINDGNDGVARALVTVNVTEQVDSTPPTASIDSVNPSIRASSVDSVLIRFSEPVNGFDLTDITLVRSTDDTVPLMPGQATLTTLDELTWTVGNLSSMTRPAGRYEIRINASGSDIRGQAGNLLTDNVNMSWLNGAGDINFDNKFDQFDLIGILQAATYRAPRSATWSQGDWNGDNRFDHLDIIAALQTQPPHYLRGPFASMPAAHRIGEDKDRETDDSIKLDVVDQLYAQWVDPPAS